MRRGRGRIGVMVIGVADRVMTHAVVIGRHTVVVMVMVVTPAMRLRRRGGEDRRTRR